MMTICDARPQHVEEILEIERQCFSVPWSENGIKFEIESEDAFFPLAIIDGKIAGFAVLHLFEDDSELFNIVVRPEYRGKKIGGKLLDAVLSFAKDNKITKVYLEVRESNFIAKTLYLKRGFESLGIRKNYYDNPKENAILMVKDMKRGTLE